MIEATYVGEVGRVFDRPITGNLQPGDKVLLTDDEWSALKNSGLFKAKKTKVKEAVSKEADEEKEE
jgi:hypothetical protein